MSHCIHEQYIYEQLQNATGDIGTFLGTENAREAFVSFEAQIHKLKNNTDYPVNIQVWKMVPRYDYRDSTYGSPGRYSGSNSLLRLLYTGKLQETNAADDALIGWSPGDSVNDRHYAQVTGPVYMSPSSNSFNSVVKTIKKYRVRTLQPGDEVTYKIVDKRPRRILTHIHMHNTGNHNPYVFAHRSKFLLFKVWGTTVGTFETDLGAEEHEKIQSSTFELQRQIFDTVTVKSLGRNYNQREWIDNRPSVLVANQLGS